MRRVAVQHRYRVTLRCRHIGALQVLEEGYRPWDECISPIATVGRSGVTRPPTVFLVRGTDTDILTPAVRNNPTVTGSTASWYNRSIHEPLYLLVRLSAIGVSVFFIMHRVFGLSYKIRPGRNFFNSQPGRTHMCYSERRICLLSELKCVHIIATSSYPHRQQLPAMFSTSESPRCSRRSHSSDAVVRGCLPQLHHEV